MKALVLEAEARTASISEIPIPRPAPNELLIKVESISLNPIDPLYVANPLGNTGRTVGSDFAGRIAEVASQYRHPPTCSLAFESLASYRAHVASTTDPVHLQNI